MIEQRDRLYCPTSGAVVLTPRKPLPPGFVAVSDLIDSSASTFLPARWSDGVPHFPNMRAFWRAVRSGLMPVPRVISLTVGYTAVDLAVMRRRHRPK